jgi:hypothetical protein
VRSTNSVRLAAVRSGLTRELQVRACDVQAPQRVLQVAVEPELVADDLADLLGVRRQNGRAAGALQDAEHPLTDPDRRADHPARVVVDAAGHEPVLPVGAHRLGGEPGWVGRRPVARVRHGDDGRRAVPVCAVRGDGGELGDDVAHDLHGEVADPLDLLPVG